MRHAVDAGRYHGAVESGLQVAVLDGVGDGRIGGQQKSGAHGHTGSTVGEGCGQTAPVEEASGRDDRNVDRVEHRGQQQRGSDRPGVTTAFTSLHDHRIGAPRRHFAGVLGRAHRRDHHGASLFQPGDQLLPWRQCERGNFHALVDHQVYAVVGVGCVRADVDAERPGRGRLDFAYRVRQFVQRHGRRRENSQTAGVRSRRHQARTGHPAHSGLHHRMLDADQLGQRCPKSHTRTSLSRRFFGSITFWISSNSSPSGNRVRSASSSPCTSNDVACRTSSGVTPG